MYNESITRSPITVFLGAGASKPLGKLLMGEFINHLRTKPEFSGDELFEAIVAEESDLEFLFEELDEWIEKGYFAGREGVSPKGIESPSASIGSTPPSWLPRVRGRSFEAFRGDLRGLIDRASELRSQLRREVFLAYRGIEDRRSVAGPFKPVFDFVSAKTGQAPPLVVFTTNYDPCIETFKELSEGQYALRDGFAHDENSSAYVWDRDCFDNFKPSPNAKDIVLFKIHGSTNWTKAGRRIVKSPAQVYVEDDSAHENVLIYPAKKKVAIEEPFFTGYDYFQKCMEKCLFCIVIGYSFRDYDALTKLMSAARDNEKLKLVFLDPKARGICEQLHARGVRAAGIPTSFTAGKGIADYLARLGSEIGPLGR